MTRFSLPFWMRIFAFVFVIALLSVTVGVPSPSQAQGKVLPIYFPLIMSDRSSNGGASPIVFVSRQIPPNGSIYWNVPKDMPGVGPRSRFRVAAPGKLQVLEPNGAVRTLIDGANPTAASLKLMDVNAPSVDYDGQRIVFAGLPQGNYSLEAIANLGAWRLYVINIDGSDLRQMTFSDQNLNLAQFGPAANGLGVYDDTDPVWLPDGRIAFSSTRWPGYAHYSGVRISNLYVVNVDGSRLHRITSERNGADRPLIDPITGKIVYSRWWRNQRFPTNSLDTITDPAGGYIQKDGLTIDRSNHVGGADNMFRNAWHAASVKPDGTELTMWTGVFRSDPDNQMYGGTFTPDGTLIANFFPMFNMTEASGFGGIRRYQRGPGSFTPIVGITNNTLNYVKVSNPTSYGIFKGNYVADPDVLPDGRLVISWAQDVNQDYGLYTVNADGSGLTKLYDNPGTTELRARAAYPRTKPPVISDTVTQIPSLLPPIASGPYDKDGTFVFNALNVYANGPVDSDIVNAPAVGSADRIRFFIDHQRTSPGSFPNQDWPILLNEMPVNPDGSVRNDRAPANVPLFEQLRSSNNTVPLTRGPRGADGSAHVSGMNFGRPGEQVRCVGCHAGHSMLPVPKNATDAQWSNVAPGAEVQVSSSRDSDYNYGLIDRRVMKDEIWRYWTSAQNQVEGQWVQLTFPVPVTVRTVRLYNPRQGDEANSSVQIGQTTVILYDDAAGTVEVARQTTGALAVTGTDVAFPEVQARTVRIQIDQAQGTFYGMEVVSLAEVEVIARGAARR